MAQTRVTVRSIDLKTAKGSLATTVKRQIMQENLNKLKVIIKDADEDSMDNQLSALEKQEDAFQKKIDKCKKEVNTSKSLTEAHMPRFLSSVFMFGVNHATTQLEHIPFHWKKDVINKAADDLTSFLEPFQTCPSRAFSFLPLTTVATLLTTLASNKDSLNPTWWMKEHNRLTVQEQSDKIIIMDSGITETTSRVFINMMSFALKVLIDEEKEEVVSLSELQQWIKSQKNNVQKYLEDIPYILPALPIEQAKELLKYLRTADRNGIMSTDFGLKMNAVLCLKDLKEASKEKPVRNNNNTRPETSDGDFSDLVYKDGEEWFTPLFTNIYLELIEAWATIVHVSSAIKSHRETLKIVYSIRHKIHKSTSYYAPNEGCKLFSMAQILSQDAKLLLKEFPYDSFLPLIEARIGSDGSLGIHNANRAEKAEKYEEKDMGSGDSVVYYSSSERNEKCFCF